jgi:hypothetical protein
MALPADTLSSCTMCVALSTNGTTWTDFSDYLTVIESPEMTRASASLPVFGEDNHILSTGKKEPFEVRVRGAYVDSTATTNPFSYVWAQWTATCGGALAVRWAPAGCASTNQVFSTATTTGHPCKVTAMLVPGGDAASADPLVWEAVIYASDLYRATWAA